MPDNLLLFIGLTTLVSLAPGPNVMYIMSQSALRGRRAGLMAGLGIQIANVVYFALTLLGLGVLIATSELLFLILKWTGAGYLALIGVMALIRSFRSHPVVDPRAVRAGGAATQSRHGQQRRLWQMLLPFAPSLLSG